jgi:hypothetical protein
MLRFNHMEITVPPGFIAQDGESLYAFLHEVLGFERSVFPGLDLPSLVVKTDEDASQFLFIAENAQPLPRASEDHLGFQLDDAASVDAVLVRSRGWQERDPRVEIRDMGVLDLDQTTTRAVYIRYLLPIWFDVQHIAAKPGFAPAREWRFLPRR